ncbi:transposase [Streptomyces sp. NRRL S-813]|uniref:transposase n=1 Tax=Streptomyces sp. NRRL S-813 TaxID=1463919 RepID=UPI003B641A58
MKPGRPQAWTRRQLIAGIRWRTRTGAPWRDVPEHHGPWDRVDELFDPVPLGVVLGRVVHRLLGCVDQRAERAKLGRVPFCSGGFGA